ncbi:MAG: cytochrome c oxidase subunit II [Bacteroidetes bacterium]|nr:MAG: cytochrome c oxidase subunit II [Bacteroidota bacterium]MBL1143431.1 cytochrome c oxidase subunit II [Bacteroidota bacterium]MCB0802572.1 cytochrome c oxidase subunit II [Flavobacteriales bacterium]NOG56235.1 cytochrome c oxidase subunit II [Bacteroidota bacterium]
MFDLLILVAVILGLIAIAKVIQVLELANNVKGTSSYIVSEKDNRTQARLMPVFLISYFAFIIWQVVKWGDEMLPVSASEHGVVIDQLMNITWMIIIPVFILTHIALFYFAWKYAYDKNRKAQFYAHNSKLEMLWTSIPALVLLILILYGLSVWGDVMAPLTEEDDPIEIELYSRQFDWTARYPGEDGVFGKSDVRLIAGVNMLGLDSTDENAWDDKYVKAEFHIPVNRSVQFYFRSQDVIHSAYMPHFRAQMNCVPGMITQFNFKPTITTAEMREITGNPEFAYYLLCNKVCGAAHYNMKMEIIVESEEDYNNWMNEQKEFMEYGKYSFSNEKNDINKEVLAKSTEAETKNSAL